MSKPVHLALIALFVTTASFAYNPLTPANLSKKPIPVNTAVTNWMSPNSFSSYYVQTGSRMTITIKVNNGGAGATLTNCSGGGSVAPGSGTVCNVSNTSMPISITSNSQTASASGTYQINPR